MATTKKATAKAAPVKKATTKKAAGLADDIIARLEAVGITQTDEAKVRKALIEFLETKEVTGVDDDSTEDLLVYVESMYDGDEEITEEDDEVEDVEELEEDTDDEEEEVVLPVKKQKGKTKAPKVIVETDEDEEELDSLVAEAAKKPSLKKAKKAKSASTSDGSRRRLQGERWENLKDTDKELMMKPFHKYFPTGKYNFEFITKGVVIKLIGASAEQNIVKMNRVRRLENGKIESSFATFRLKTLEELEGYVSDAVADVKEKKIKKGDGSTYYVHPMSQDEIIKILKDSDFIAVSLERATKHDTKLAKNREKLDTQIKGTVTIKKDKSTVKVKPVAKKAPVVAVIEEEEEEEVVTPKKKAVTATKAKPVVATPVKKKTKAKK